MWGEAAHRNVKAQLDQVLLGGTDDTGSTFGVVTAEAEAQVQAAGEGNESADERGREYICPYECVQPDKLVWCSDAVTYPYCNRVVDTDGQGDQFRSNLYMEDAAMRAYRAVLKEIPGGEMKDACKSALRAWMCYSFFNKCANDLVRYYPVCMSACENAKAACGGVVWMNCQEGVEEGDPVFEADELVCTGAAPTSGSSHAAWLAATAAAVGAVRRIY